MTNEKPAARRSEIVVRCADLDAAMRYFIDTLGFRLEAIFPADAPRVAVVQGGGNRLRLERGAGGAPVSLRLSGFDAAAPGDPPEGIEVELTSDAVQPEVPALAPALHVHRADSGAWVTGRAGMQYLDLLPDRQGGRFIASHIRIPSGGPVPDYVHHHAVRFQMIYCYRGWVRVVYEDQGEPFVMEAGDCVLQPPHIRHRVLECSDGFEVVEIGCPAEHQTLVDHELELPNPGCRPDRDFHGQRFVFHQASKVPYAAWRPGYEARDTGIGAATRGLAGARVIRPSGGANDALGAHDAEFVFRFVLSGQVQLQLVGDGGAARGGENLGVGDAATIPAGIAHGLISPSADFQMLEVSLPADYRANQPTL